MIPKIINVKFFNRIYAQIYLYISKILYVLTLYNLVTIDLDIVN